ncbi:hypothetical protein [Streptococcus ruminantium]|uniref:hypothetical protein n=1 Tax=Streptococcus ruminantium TaxID=1917441 RepID=UPI0012DE3B67|nr:hypothetical protein [Streptococcus ruminantium]
MTLTTELLKGGRWACEASFSYQLYFSTVHRWTVCIKRSLQKDVALSHKDDKYAEIVTDRAQGLIVYSISNSLSNGFSGWDYA